MDFAAQQTKLPRAFHGLLESKHMNYATFWQRFWAMWIDCLVLLPVVALDLWAQSLSKAVSMALLLPTTALYLGYQIYCHGRFGQTVGKRIMGIRVSRLTGEPIGWRQAWLRSLVDIVFSVLGVFAAFVALVTISDADYYGFDWWERIEALAEHEPAWLDWTAPASTVWVWSEVIVMLFNSRRRALHDFIAGTVVTQVKPASDSETCPDENVK